VPVSQELHRCRGPFAGKLRASRPFSAGPRRHRNERANARAEEAAGKCGSRRPPRGPGRKYCFGWGRGSGRSQFKQYVSPTRPKGDWNEKRLRLGRMFRERSQKVGNGRIAADRGPRAAGAAWPIQRGTRGSGKAGENHPLSEGLREHLWIVRWVRMDETAR